MKKTTIAIGIALIILIVVFLSYIFISQRENIIKGRTTSVSPTKSSLSSPTPTQVDQIEVIEVSPVNEAINVPIDSQIIISFNEEVNSQQITFSIGPSVQFKQEIVKNKAIISFIQPLAPGTFYTYTIKFPKSNLLPQSFFFTTSGPTQRYLPNTYPGHVE